MQDQQSIGHQAIESVNEVVISPNEQIYRAYRRHWAELLPYSGFALIFVTPPILAWLYIQQFATESDPIIQLGFWLVYGIYFVFGACFIFMEWLFWYLDVWIITSERLIDIELTNLFQRQVSELHISQVQDVHSDQTGILATFFNYGNVICQTAGLKNYFALRGIPHPEEAASLILDLHESYIEEEHGDNTVHTREVFATHKSLEDILIRQGYLTETQLQAFKQANSHLTPDQLGDALVEGGLLNSRQLIEALGLQYSIPVINLAMYDLDEDTLGTIQPDLAHKFNIIPLSRTPHSLTLAIGDPRMIKQGRYLSQLIGMPVAFVLADMDEIKEKIYTHYSNV